MSAISRYPLLTPDQELELGALVRDGSGEARDAAIEKLVVGNLRLVIHIASDFTGYGLELEDLVSAGNSGLAIGAERFDPGQGCSFATYSSYWIKAKMRLAIARYGHPIRRPVFQCIRITQLNKASMQLSESLGREPSDNELAEATGFSSSQVSDLRRMSMRPASLDAAAFDDTPDATLGEIIPDEGAVSPHEQISGMDMHKEVLSALDILNARERQMIVDRFGLNGEEAMTLKECGQRWGVTTERTRQILIGILAKLRRKIQQRENPERLCMNGHNGNGQHHPSKPKNKVGSD